jgi:hypothetical protein
MSSLEKVGIVVRVLLYRNRCLHRSVIREGRYSCKSAFTKKCVCLHKKCRQKDYTRRLAKKKVKEKVLHKKVSQEKSKGKRVTQEG